MISPIVRIEVEHMKQAIVAAFSEMQIRNDQQFQEAMKHALAAFDFEREIRQAATEVLRKSIDSAIQQAAYEALRDPVVKAAILKVAARVMAESLA